MINGCGYAVNGKSFRDQTAGWTISNNFERNDGARVKKRLRSGVIFEPTDKSPRDRSIAPNEIRRGTQRRSSGFRRFDRKVSRNSSDYVDSYESTAIFDSQDSPRDDENLARSRDENWDHPVKNLFDDREEEILSKSS